MDINKFSPATNNYSATAIGSLGLGAYTRAESNNDDLRRGSTMTSAPPIVGHLTQLNGRLENIEDNLKIVRALIVGEDGICESNSLASNDLQGQVLCAERLILKIEDIVEQIKNRLM